jgi:hypothetical protein
MVSLQMTATEQYTDDAPIASSDEDRFSRWPFAERIAQIIAKRTDPASIVLGIYGPWGDGKTSVLNMMDQALEGNEAVVSIKFNPWHFEDEEHLIRAFFDTLADALKATLKTKGEAIGEFLGKYCGILSLASSNVGAAAKSVGQQLSTVHFDELKRRVSELLVESGKRVVVLIDDIDRLDRSEIHAMLKLVKLSASFSNTAYVLAFDDEVVAASLGDRYGAGGADAGQQFLEKIIQVPLHLPDAEGVDLRSMCFEGVDEVISENAIDLGEDDAEAFVRHFTEGIMPALHTPRQVKRYINAIRFAVPLLKGEVYMVDQLLIEALRTAYPNLYLSVRDNGDLYTGELLPNSLGDGTKQKEAAKTTVEEGLSGLSGVQREGALHVLKALFPRLNGIFGNTNYGREWNKTWDADRRITSDDYFRRYFQYSVPTRDIADAKITELIEAAEKSDVGAIDAFFDEIGKRKAWTRCIDKLFARISEFEAVGAKALALGLARQAKTIPKEKGMFSSFMSSSSRAAGLASKLIENIADVPTRVKIAIDAVNEATALSFATDCLRWLSVKGKKNDEKPALDEQQQNKLGAVVAARIARAFTENPDYATYGRDVSTLLWIWKRYGTNGDMAAFIGGRIKQNPDEAIRFLDALIGRAYGLESGLSHKHDFDRSEFDAVAVLIGPEIVLEALTKRFGDILKHVTFDKCYELTGDKQTACRFVAIYNKVRQENAAKAGSGAASVDAASGEE